MALSWWRLDRLAPSRRVFAIALRSAAIAAVVLALARPQLLSTQSSMAVIGVLDVSGSLDRYGDQRPEQTLADFVESTSSKAPEDRVGLVAFDGRARAVMVPTAMPRPIDALEVALHDGTALAEAVALARALIPGGEAGRVVVISDGLETHGSVASILDAEPSGRVAIDTVLAPLRDIRDVAIDGFDLPASALPRSIVSALVTVRATAPTSGVMRFRMDGRALPLRGAGTVGDALPVELGAGATTVRAQLPIGAGPVHQLEVLFEAVDSEHDRIPENSRAQRVIAVPAGRSVLALGVDGTRKPTDALLEAAGFEVRRMPADALPEDPLWLAGFDLVLLDDVPAGQLSATTQELLVDHVQRLGGGLLCTGGPDTFGPGGWRGSVVAALLPIEVEPPTELRRPRSAVVFVIDRSGSMRQSVAGARASQQQVANEAAAMAIESIASRAFVGVIAFDNAPTTVVPIAPLDDPAAAAARVRTIEPDGGTAIGAALRAALDALDTVGDVDQKLVVLLTDGVGRDDDLLREQAARAASSKVNVTTIGVGDATDDAMLAEVAERTQGKFHQVRQPRVLPRVLIESVQSVNRPLVREGSIAVMPIGDSDLALALRSAPALGGIAVMGRPRSAEALLDAETDKGEPLFARWSAGVGRVAVFASEFSGPWSESWATWPGAAGFWEFAARWCARAPGSAPVSAEARIVDGRFTVTLDAAAADAVDGAIVDGVVRTPRGERRAFSLRRVAPRRFTGSIEVDETGPWLAVLSPRGASGPLPPILAAAVAPEGAEFERRDADPLPLAELRRASGGREIPIDALARTDLFTRDGLVLGRRERLLAPELLVLAALLFIADTALRRLAVRKQMLVEAVHITSAEGRAAEELSSRRRSVADARAMVPGDAARPALRAAQATVAGIGEAHGTDTFTARASSATAGRATASGGAGGPAPDAVVRTPSAESVRDALAALRGNGGSSAAKDAASAANASSDPSASNAPSDEDASHGALDALRRARERSRIFPP